METNIKKTSIVILTLNQFSHTLRCLESIRQYTPEPYELIVVDNGSTDTTLPHLMFQSDVILIKNVENVGFAKGCNQGAAIATGDYILYLNNDTIVTPNWLTHMLNALHSSEDVAMVGPVTNYSSGHQQIPVTYTDASIDLSDLFHFAVQHAAKFAGKVTEVRKLIGFCMLVKRDVQEEIGRFDERYGLGNYEDDDLCLRMANAGYRMLVANDAFVHHVGHVTLDQLKQASLMQLLKVNREQARKKWGANISDLLYKADATFSFCIYWTDSEDCLHDCLASIQEIADEIMIIIHNYKQDNPPALSAKVRWVTFAGGEEDGEYLIWQQALSLSTMDYVFLMQASEYLLACERRKLRALKRMLVPEVVAVMMKANSINVSQTGEYGERVRLIHRHANLELALHPDQNDNSNSYMKSEICIERSKKKMVYN